MVGWDISTNSYHKSKRGKMSSAQRSSTQYKNQLLMGRVKWIRDSKFGQNDHCAIESGSEPKNMGVPEKSASLASDGEVVYIALPCLNWALCYIGRPIGPSCP